MDLGIILLIYNQINTQVSGQWVIASIVSIASAFAVHKYINIDNQKKIIDLGAKTDNLALRINELEKNHALIDNNYEHLLKSNKELKDQNAKIIDALESIKLSCAGKGKSC